jgi:hypothetical protein
MGRKMLPAIRGVLLHKSNAKLGDAPNVLDYPGSMSQWEEREPRGGSRAFLWQKKKDANQPTENPAI